MRESLDSTKSKGAMKVKALLLGGPRSDPLRPEGAQDWPVSKASSLRRSKSVHVGTRKMVNYA